MMPAGRGRCYVGLARAEGGEKSAIACPSQPGVPTIFPSGVLSRALNRPFVPPTPRLAIKSYWGAHPFRADRLARALAARSAAPSGWTWRLGTARAACPSRSARHPRPTAKAHTHWARDFAACAVKQFIASAGTLTFGALVPTRMPSGTALASSRGSTGMRRVARPNSCAPESRRCTLSGGRLWRNAKVESRPAV